MNVLFCFVYLFCFVFLFFFVLSFFFFVVAVDLVGGWWWRCWVDVVVVVWLVGCGGRRCWVERTRERGRIMNC